MIQKGTKDFGLKIKSPRNSDHVLKLSSVDLQRKHNNTFLPVITRRHSPTVENSLDSVCSINELGPRLASPTAGKQTILAVSPEIRNVTPRNMQPFRSYAAPVITLSPRGEAPKRLGAGYTDERTEFILYQAKNRAPFGTGRKKAY